LGRVRCGTTAFGVFEKLYSVFPDAFDFVAIMPAAQIFDPSRGYAENVPYEVNVRNADQNIGLGTVDRGAEFHSPARLKSMIYHSFGYGAILDHEVGHRWVLGFGRSLGLSDGVHWDANTDIGGQMASFVFLPGGRTGRLTDNADGTWRVERDPANREPYSKLDLYLMGLLPPAAVPPLHKLTNPDFADPDRHASTPSTGVPPGGPPRHGSEEPPAGGGQEHTPGRGACSHQRATARRRRRATFHHLHRRRLPGSTPSCRHPIRTPPEESSPCSDTIFRLSSAGAAPPVLPGARSPPAAVFTAGRDRHGRSRSPPRASTGVPAGQENLVLTVPAATTLKITGGWNSDFSARVANPTLTILDGGSLDSVLWAEVGAGSTLELNALLLRFGHASRARPPSSAPCACSSLHRHERCEWRARLSPPSVRELDPNPSLLRRCAAPTRGGGLITRRGRTAARFTLSTCFENNVAEVVASPVRPRSRLRGARRGDQRQDPRQHGARQRGARPEAAA
jgi:hypothetical protein